MSTMTSYLEELVRRTHKTEAEVKAMAMETGLRQLWREQILDQYLHGQITRDQAVESIGAVWVDMADRQRQAMQEDLQWAKAAI
jgi:hypothetical protein